MYSSDIRSLITGPGTHSTGLSESTQTIRLPIKKSIFPVQRVAKTMVSRAAAFSFSGVGKYSQILEKNCCFCKNEKKKSPVTLF